MLRPKLIHPLQKHRLRRISACSASNVTDSDKSSIIPPMWKSTNELKNETRTLFFSPQRISDKRDSAVLRIKLDVY